MTENNEKKRRGSVHRSPSYPQVSLREALKKARIIYDNEKKNSAPIEIICDHWGYTVTSGFRTIAALKQFKLIVEKGVGKNREIRLTELSLDILLDEREDSIERDEAVKKAALSPKLYLDLWNKWGNEMPSQGVIRTYLIKDKGFNEKSVLKVVETYRNTITFAKLETEEINLKSEPNNEEERIQEERIQEENENIANLQDINISRVNSNEIQFSTPENMKDFPIYLSNNLKAVLSIPSSLSKNDFKLLKLQIENSLHVIEAISVNLE